MTIPHGYSAPAPPAMMAGSDFGQSQMRPPAPPLSFKEFLVCKMCSIPQYVAISADPSAKFWITSCGHILCDNHPHQQNTCTYCNRTGVTIVLLDINNPPPLLAMRLQPIERSRQSIISTVEALAHQNKDLLQLARYQKNRIMHLEGIISKVEGTVAGFKAERNELQRKNDDLTRQMSELRAQNANLHARNKTLSDKLYRDKGARPLGMGNMGQPPVQHIGGHPSHVQPGFGSGLAALKHQNAELAAAEGFGESNGHTKRPREEHAGYQFEQEHPEYPVRPRTVMNRPNPSYGAGRVERPQSTSGFGELNGPRTNLEEYRYRAENPGGPVTVQPTSGFVLARGPRYAKPNYAQGGYGHDQLPAVQETGESNF